MNVAKFFHLYTGELDTNTYIVINGREGFVVDPGGEADEIFKIFKREKARIVAILLTHAHFDHIAGVKALSDLQRNLAGGEECYAPKILMHKNELAKINSYKNMGFSKGVQVDKFVPDVLLSGGENINVAGLDIKVILTKGHSEGSVCYVVGNKIFCGDTIFFMSYGRTDFPGGSEKELKNAIINKLFRLKGNYTLLPGHGEPSTLDFERVNNPILEKTPHVIAD